jgi:hypothetical protein
MNYFRNHWQGNLSFALSFWINLVLVRGLILYLEQYTHPPFAQKSALVIGFAIAYFVVFNLALFTWQVRGVIKASDRYVSGYGAPIVAMASHFGIVVCLLFTGFSSHEAYQSLFVKDLANSENYLSRRHTLLGDYSLKLTTDKQHIILEGDFRVGVTDDLNALLTQNPGVTGIVLASNGGRVAEGRGLARLFRQRMLATYVFDECKSACTTAFIGGTRRIMGPAGKLGFHQFSLDNVYNNPYIDPKSEQNIDLVFYAGQGIDPDFLNKVFQASHRDMWFPENSYLLSTGVVHTILGANEGPGHPITSPVVGTSKD